MFARTYFPEQFLRGIYGTEPFIEYCRERGIGLDQVPGSSMRPRDFVRWIAALAQLPGDAQRGIERELAKVNELAAPASLDHLLEACSSRGPPPDSIPGGAPIALWILLRAPSLFQEVFLHDEMYEIDAWHNAQAPAGLLPDDLEGRAEALAARLRDFFQRRDGTGRFCTVSAYPLGEAVCFVAEVADRVQMLECYTDEGERITQRLRLIFSVTFVYHTDGTLLLKSRVMAREHLLTLLQEFARAVLDAELPAKCLDDTFQLEPLKQEFAPLPDAEDMESIRIRSLQFRYPERAGRRQIRLQTVAADHRTAVSDLLRAHLPDGRVLAEMHVSRAELEVRLRTNGRSRAYVIRLWANRCNLNPTAVGERLRACLKRWGLLHVRP